MPGPTFVRGDRVALRTVEPEDHAFVQRHWNDPATRRGFNRTVPKTAEGIAEMLAAGNDPDGPIHLLACRDGDPVGFLWLFRIDRTAGRAEMGYWVTPDEQGNGYATEMAALGVAYAFDELRMHKVTARVFAGNEASMRVLRKVGFEEEGRRRDHHYVNGEHRDTHVFGLLAGEHRSG